MDQIKIYPNFGSVFLYKYILMNSTIYLKLSFCMFVRLSVHIFDDPSDKFQGNWKQTGFRGSVK